MNASCYHDEVRLNSEGKWGQASRSPRFHTTAFLVHVELLLLTSQIVTSWIDPMWMPNYVEQTQVCLQERRTCIIRKRNIPPPSWRREIKMERRNSNTVTKQWHNRRFYLELRSWSEWNRGLFFIVRSCRPDLKSVHGWLACLGDMRSCHAHGKWPMKLKWFYRHVRIAEFVRLINPGLETRHVYGSRLWFRNPRVNDTRRRLATAAMPRQGQRYRPIHNTNNSELLTPVTDTATSVTL
jgi:hypothetical protein